MSLDKQDKKRAYRKAYYWAHREAAKAYNDAHREEKRARDRARYRTNPEYFIAKRRAEYSANPEREKAYTRAYRIKHPEYGKNYRLMHREHYCDIARDYRSLNREKMKAHDVSKSAMIKDRDLRRKYGISKHDFDIILANQGGCCAICGVKKYCGNGWVVDHDHVNGRVRGILCSNCNSVLGFSKDSPRILNKAIEYLGRDIVPLEEAAHV